MPSVNEKQNCDDTVLPFELALGKEPLNVDGVVNQQMYLLCAQDRYIEWLKMISNYKDEKIVPLPPIGMHVDPISQEIWEKNTGEPWILDITNKKSFIVQCPWCRQEQIFSTSEWVKIMRTPKHVEKCKSFQCHADWSTETLSAYRFLKDVNNYIADKTKFLGGTLIDLTGEYSPKLFETESGLVFSIKWDTSNSTCHWSNIHNIIEAKIMSIESTSQLTATLQNFVRRVVSAYSSISAPFSLDLVSAVLRQHTIPENVWYDGLAETGRLWDKEYKEIFVDPNYPESCAQSSCTD
ncbi:8355_t:CDS:2, partial [Racocetra fulgida]